MPSVQTVSQSLPTLVLSFQRIRMQSEPLAKPLSAEDCQLQSMPDASPTKWHMAHLTWFFETFVLEKYEANFQPFDASFRVLFNSYYNGIGGKHPRAQRGLISRPTLAGVMAYRKAVDKRVLAVLSEHSHDGELAQLITLGLHHEQQHQELLLTDIKHALSMNPATSMSTPYAKRWPLSSIAPQPVTRCGYEGGLVKHGFSTASDDLAHSFAFDNETPCRHTYLAPFQLASWLVTKAITWLSWRMVATSGLSCGWLWVGTGCKPGSTLCLCTGIPARQYIWGMRTLPCKA